MELRSQIKLINASFSDTLDLYRVWAKRNGISYNALLVLYTLDDYGVCTQKQICGWWDLPKQTVHGILLDFEKRGYLSASANDSNKRERLITFTAAGRCFADSILVKLHRMEERAMQNLGVQRRQQLIACNEDYYRLLKKELENE